MKQRLMPGWIILMGALTAIGPLSIDMYLPRVSRYRQRV
jgi:DHA1 family bicyclomycin/chloramphenicol resistance-like MFS transporter